MAWCSVEHTGKALSRLAEMVSRLVHNTRTPVASDSQLRQRHIYNPDERSDKLEETRGWDRISAPHKSRTFTKT
jgi:hypothetical protein